MLIWLSILPPHGFILKGINFFEQGLKPWTLGWLTSTKAIVLQTDCQRVVLNWSQSLELTLELPPLSALSVVSFSINPCGGRIDHHISIPKQNWISDCLKDIKHVHGLLVMIKWYEYISTLRIQMNKPIMMTREQIMESM